MARNYKQGFFNPKFPEKYQGDPKNIVYRSSWELKFMKFCDESNGVIKWSSEELTIPYIKPTDKKMHRYFPDFCITYKNKSGKIISEVIEIKPKHQTNLKKAKTPLAKLEYEINKAKWIAATKWCKQRNINFRIMTEQEIFR